MGEAAMVTTGETKARKLKMVDKKRNRQIVAIQLSDENLIVTAATKLRTRRSYSQILNGAIGFAVSKGYFETVESHEPASVRRARETLQKWEVGPAMAPKRGKAQVVPATAKRRGRPRKSEQG